MKAQIILERNKYKFASVYILSVILVAAIFVALWNMFSTPKPASALQQQAATVDEIAILKQDEMLHVQLENLQQLDAKYKMLLATSETKLSLDNVEKEISVAETSFGNLLDTLANQKTSLKSTASQEKWEKMTAAFKSVLDSRKSTGYMRGPLSGNVKQLSTSEKDVLKMKLELDNKNHQIIALENQIKNQQNSLANNTTGTTSPTQFEQQVTALRANLSKEKESTAAQLYINSRLTTQLIELKASYASVDEKRKLEQGVNDILIDKLDDLDAKLLLAKIDCNLSRADAKQIISNSKQRKELLQESLSTLNSLAHSSNPSVQTKAKEKLNQLKGIVATIRD
ncbi:MAG: hypothetical protein ABIU30_08805 [Ferruginibacter sp.]